MGRPGEIIRPTDAHRRAAVGSDEPARPARELTEAFEEGAWGGPIVAIASTRLDRPMLVRDAREWTLCTSARARALRRVGDNAPCAGAAVSRSCATSLTFPSRTRRRRERRHPTAGASAGVGRGDGRGGSAPLAPACVARVQAGNAPPVELREAVPGVSTMSMPSCSSAPMKGA